MLRNFGQAPFEMAPLGFLLTQADCSTVTGLGLRNLPLLPIEFRLGGMRRLVVAKVAFNINLRQKVLAGCGAVAHCDSDSAIEGYYGRGLGAQ